MSLTRRNFIARSLIATIAGAAVAACSRPEPDRPSLRRTAILTDANDWSEVREQFALSPDFIHMSALFIASHPKPVREAIERHRRELDASPVIYLQQENQRRIDDALAAAARYLGVNDPDDIALTDSTTEGLGLIYNGLRFAPGDEVLTTEHDYYVTHESLRLAAERKGIRVRRIPLYEKIQTVTEDEVTTRLVRAVSPRTRALALTWVHSGTGLKLPLSRIADAVKQLNKKRKEADRILICVDAVHGFGVEDVEMSDLGCDFFIAGCHKWLFGPRGTGLIWGSRRGWGRVLPTVPSFLDDGMRQAWLKDAEVEQRTTGRQMAPGGFKPFEHQWALAEAFEFQSQIGKSRVAARTHELASQLKEGLSRMSRMNLYTPRGENLSSGIVCFNVRGMSPFTAADRLRRRGVICTVTPYAERYVRLAPSIRNTPSEVETALREIRALA